MGPPPTVDISFLGPGDEAVLEGVTPDVFDAPVRPERVREFLGDPRHHVVVARDGRKVLGFATGMHYVHPDKEPELWINELGVVESHRRLGVATGLVRALLDRGAALGCREAWVLTERSNTPAVALYEAVGGRQPEEETVMFSFLLES